MAKLIFTGGLLWRLDLRIYIDFDVGDTPPAGRLFRGAEYPCLPMGAQRIPARGA